MIMGWREPFGALLLAMAATGASTTAITAAPAVMSFLFRVISASLLKDGTQTEPNVDLARLSVVPRSLLGKGQQPAECAHRPAPPAHLDVRATDWTSPSVAWHGTDLQRFG
jgi:hypothetical protein